MVEQLARVIVGEERWGGDSQGLPPEFNALEVQIRNTTENPRHQIGAARSSDSRVDERSVVEVDGG